MIFIYTKNYVKRLFITVSFLLIHTLVIAQGNTGLKSGRLVGTIRDDNNLPIAGVSISIAQTTEAKSGTSTSISGDYVLTLAPGNYTIVISYVGYESQKISEVVIRVNEQTDLSVTMFRNKKETLGDVVVTSTRRQATTAGLLQTQKNSASMTDGISAEQMAKLPDANIAKVLKRVSGLTVQGEKFVTIRGISDRYINVMINGSILPSTEPNRRNFSFDIIPSALVENVVVNKTATPDLSGEFTGGIVQVFTKDVPVKNFLQVTVGTGLNTESFDRTFVSFARDEKAHLGKINADRLWFGDGRLLDPNKYLRDDNSETNRIIRSKVPNAWQTEEYAYQPVQNYQISGGVSKRFSNNNSFGIIGAVTYLNEQLSEEGLLGISTKANYASIRNKYNTSLGAILNATFKTPTHKISIKNLYNQRYSDQYDHKQGYHFDFQTEHSLFSNVTIQNRLFQTRIEGEHLLTSRKIKLDWSADNIQLNREQPHTRGMFVRDAEIPAYDFAYAYKGLLGLYSAVLDESRRSAAANLSFPFTIGEKKQLIKIGYNYTKRGSDLNAVLFNIFADSLRQLPEGTPYYQSTTPENFRNGYLTFRQFGNSTSAPGDAYDGTQELHATYAMADLRFLKKFRFIGGLRNENNTSEVFTHFYLYPSPLVLRIVDSTKKYFESDLLPSANLIYNLTDKINIRAAFSKTIARPELVERSPYLYVDVAEQLTVTGRKELEISRIKNYDLRVEYYPSPGEIFSVSVFYKDFDKPVERLYLVDGSQPGLQYRNMKSATAKGFELDIRKSLSFFSPSSAILKRFLVSGNFTYIDGRIIDLVSVTLINPYRDSSYEVNTKRPLQGLSPFIVNAGVSYDDIKWGFNISLNRAGRRNITGGSNFQATQFESPRTLLDLQLNRKFFKQKMEVKLNCSDLLNQPFIIYTNTTKQDVASGQALADNNDPKGAAFNENLDYINYKVRKGTTISVSASYRF